MAQIFEIHRPRGWREYKSTVTSPTAGAMSLQGRTDAFTFTLARGEAVLMGYAENDGYVHIGGKSVPISCDSWKDWQLQFTLNHNYYSCKFKRMNLLKYAMHHAVIREAEEIADLHSVINSQVLFFKTGGRVRMELKEGIPFLEPLFYAIAWWWSGYYTDNTTT